MKKLICSFGQIRIKCLFKLLDETSKKPTMLVTENLQNHEQRKILMTRIIPTITVRMCNNPKYEKLKHKTISRWLTGEVPVSNPGKGDNLLISD